MAKEYLCKDCEHNNHGWCKIKKMNGLKEITSCEHKGTTIKANFKAKVTSVKRAESIKFEEDSSFEHEALGKRQMLWAIQRQAIAIKLDNTIENKFEELCKCINSLAKHQNFSETIGNFEDILMETDVMMINDSKRLAEIL